jgi:hypothetical protein
MVSSNILFFVQRASSFELHREECESTRNRIEEDCGLIRSRFLTMAETKMVSISKKKSSFVCQPEPFAIYTISSEGAVNSGGSFF